MSALPNDSIIAAARVAFLALNPDIFAASCMRATISALLALYQGKNGAVGFGVDADAGVDVDATRGFLAFASAGSTDVGFSAGFSAGFAGVALRPRGAGSG